MTAMPVTPRRPTNLTLDAAMISEARSLGINISQACERGLASAIAAARAQHWLSENADALQSSNDYVEAHGLPLARYRAF